MAGLTISDIENALRTIGDGWGPLEEVTMGGMMENYGLALHYRARSPELSVHIKVYLPSGSGESLGHQRTGSPTRHARLRGKFESLQSNQGVSTVPIRLITFLCDCLIVVMDKVSSVGELLEHDTLAAQADAPTALRQLDTRGRWMHFDLCPDNVGRASDGQYCYIDLESVYEVGESGSVVSEPVTKVERLPDNLRSELEQQFTSKGGLSAEFAERFQNYQLARLAMDMCAGRILRGANISSLADTAPLNRSFWDRHFVSLAAQDAAPSPSELADAIESGEPIVRN